MDEQKKAGLTAEADGVIEGRNAVIEALRAGETIDKIYLQKGETDKTLGHIASKARAMGVVVVEADKRKLDGMSPHPCPPGGHRPGGRAGVCQRGEHPPERCRQGGNSPAGDLRRDLRSP